MKIRRARKDDVDDFIELFKETSEYHGRFEEMYAGLSKDDLEDRKKSFMKTIGKKLEVTFVAEQKGKMVGYVWGGVRGKKDNRFGLVYDIIVTFSYRKKGLGKKLMSCMKKFFKERGCKKVKLSAFKRNKPAMSMYRNLGFKDVNIVYQMEKKI